MPEGQKMFTDNLIVNEKIDKGKRIGNGQFGEVFKGKNHCHRNNRASIRRMAEVSTKMF